MAQERQSPPRDQAPIISPGSPLSTLSPSMQALIANSPRARDFFGLKLPAPPPAAPTVRRPEQPPTRQPTHLPPPPAFPERPPVETRRDDGLVPSPNTKAARQRRGSPILSASPTPRKIEIQPRQPSAFDLEKHLTATGEKPPAPSSPETNSQAAEINRLYQELREAFHDKTIDDNAFKFLLKDYLPLMSDVYNFSGLDHPSAAPSDAELVDLVNSFIVHTNFPYIDPPAGSDDEKHIHAIIAGSPKAIQYLFAEYETTTNQAKRTEILDRISNAYAKAAGYPKERRDELLEEERISTQAFLDYVSSHQEPNVSDLESILKRTNRTSNNLFAFEKARQEETIKFVDAIAKDAHVAISFEERPSGISINLESTDETEQTPGEPTFVKVGRDRPPHYPLPALPEVPPAPPQETKSPYAPIAVPTVVDVSTHIPRAPGDFDVPTIPGGVVGAPAAQPAPAPTNSMEITKTGRGIMDRDVVTREKEPEPVSAPIPSPTILETGQQALTEIRGLGIPVDSNSTTGSLMDQLTPRGWQNDEKTQAFVARAIELAKLQAATNQPEAQPLPPPPPIPQSGLGPYGLGVSQGFSPGETGEETVARPLKGPFVVTHDAQPQIPVPATDLSTQAPIIPEEPIAIVESALAAPTPKRKVAYVWEVAAEGSGNAGQALAFGREIGKATGLPVGTRRKGKNLYVQIPEYTGDKTLEEIVREAALIAGIQNPVIGPFVEKESEASQTRTPAPEATTPRETITQGPHEIVFSVRGKPVMELSRALRGIPGVTLARAGVIMQDGQPHLAIQSYQGKKPLSQVLSGLATTLGIDLSVFTLNEISPERDQEQSQIPPATTPEAIAQGFRRRTEQRDLIRNALLQNPDHAVYDQLEALLREAEE